jgi:stage II sporulation protein D
MRIVVIREKRGVWYRFASSFDRLSRSAMDGRKLIPIALAAALASAAWADRIPVVRVGLASLGSHASVCVTSEGAFGAVDPATNTRLAAWKPNEQLTLIAEGSNVVIGEKRLAAVYFSSEAPAMKVTAGNAARRYRGWLYIFATAGKLTLVNELPLESYLMGVVPCEMGNGSPMEALKAQAVAARTYTLTKVGAFAKHGYDVDDTTRCHLYRGMDAEKASTNEAIRLTANQIVTYAGRPIQAVYATVSGGVTADAREAFGGAGAPYLIPINDRDPKGNFYGAHAKFFAWYVDLPAAAVRAKFKERGVDFGAIENVEVIDRGPSGRAVNIRLTTEQGMITLNATLIRDAFGVDVIRSTLFTISKTATGYRVDGRGWGHGAGMCQAGAIGRARAGQSYGQILAAYYPGTQLVTVSEPLDLATRGSYVDRIKFLSNR